MSVAINTLACAKRLREAGFSEQQAEGQAEALAAAMTESIATKQDLKHELAELETRMHARFETMNGRLDAFEHRMELRIDELEKRVDLRMSRQLADLERRMTLRMLTGIVVVPALVKLL